MFFNIPVAALHIAVVNHDLSSLSFTIYLACVAGGFLGFLNFYCRTRAEKIREGAKRRRGKMWARKPPAEKPYSNELRIQNY